MDALDHVEGELTRKLYSDKVPTLEWRQGLMAIKDRQAFDNAEADYGRDAANKFDTYRNPPGDPVTRVSRIDSIAHGCIVFDGTRDFGPQFTTQPSADTLNGVVFLRLKAPERDPRRLNPTAWSVTGDGKPKPGADLEHACA